MYSRCCDTSSSGFTHAATRSSASLSGHQTKNPPTVTLTFSITKCLQIKSVEAVLERCAKRLTPTTTKKEPVLLCNKPAVRCSRQRATIYTASAMSSTAAKAAAVLGQKAQVQLQEVVTNTDKVASTTLAELNSLVRALKGKDGEHTNNRWLSCLHKKPWPKKRLHSLSYKSSSRLVDQRTTYFLRASCTRVLLA